jgi:hypothetical protein
VAVRAKLTYAVHPSPELFQLEIMPRVYLSSDVGIRAMKPCPGCGRYAFSKPKGRSLVLDRTSIPPDADIFRLIDLPTFVVVTDRFVETTRRREIENVEFEAIDVE